MGPRVAGREPDTGCLFLCPEFARRRRLFGEGQINIGRLRSGTLRVWAEVRRVGPSS